MSTVDLSPLQLAKINTGFVKGMQTQCMRKCIAGYNTDDLSHGEKSCIDRCVYKFFMANEHIKELYAKEKIGPS